MTSNGTWRAYYEQRLRSRGLAGYFAHKRIKYDKFLGLVESQVRSGDDRSLLEAGSGTGMLSALLVGRGHHCELLDADPGMLALSEEVFGTLGCKAVFHHGDIRDTNFAPRQFSVAFNFGVLEHLSDDDICGSINELRRVADVFVFGVPTALTGADPNDYFGDERYLSGSHWRWLVRRTNSEVIAVCGLEEGRIERTEGEKDWDSLRFLLVALR